ncbi:MAG: Bacterioferritin, partial [uncultured Craurococcus sp.]
EGRPQGHRASEHPAHQRADGDQPVLPPCADPPPLGRDQAWQARIRRIDRGDAPCRLAHRAYPVPRRAAEPAAAEPGAGRADGGGDPPRRHGHRGEGDGRPARGHRLCRERPRLRLARPAAEDPRERGGACRLPRPAVRPDQADRHRALHPAQQRGRARPGI